MLYRIQGIVVHGDHRGRTLGFPTANIKIETPDQPASGVYAVRALVRSAWLPGVANIGVRPTFASHQPPSIEVHLLDFEGCLYDEEVTVDVVARLRNERTFNGIESLIRQIHQDVAAARVALLAAP